MQFKLGIVAAITGFISTTAAQGAGQATFYDATVGLGACGWQPPYWNGHLGTAASPDVFQNKAMCGTCVSVTGPNGNTVTAMITDLCPGCDVNSLDLDIPAFQQIGDMNMGTIPIVWQDVSC